MGDASRWVFNRLAEAYRHRPGYPPELLERLVSLAEGGPVVDLGAGTGLIAVPLAQRGLHVHAVEPARAMLEVLAERAAAVGAPTPAVHAIHACAEDTGLPDASMKLAVIADALHWIDPELAGRELARIVAPGGTVAIVESASAPTPFMSELEALLARFNPRAQRVRPGGALEQVMRMAGASGALEAEAFSQSLVLDPDVLEGIVRSYSFAGPALGESALRELLELVRQTWARYGAASWSRVLRLTSGSVSQAKAPEPFQRRE